MLKFGMRFQLKSGLVVMQHLKKHYSIFINEYTHNLNVMYFKAREINFRVLRTSGSVGDLAAESVDVSESCS